MVLLPYPLAPSVYGPVLTLAQAKAMPALAKDGWSSFFDRNFSDYWLCGKRSGLLPVEWCDARLLLPQIWLALLLPWVLWRRRSLLSQRGTLSKAQLLIQVVVASVSLFAIAHLFLFRLHLPSRYTEHSLRMVSAIAAAITVTLWAERQQNKPRFITGLTFWTVAPLVIYFAFLSAISPVGNYTQGQFPQLYQFFQTQPKDIQIASLASEANNLPSFAQRSIFVGGEGYALPYHRGYYAQIHQRTVDLINAQYTPAPAELRRFIDQYGIDFWLLESDAFSLEWVQRSAWLRQYAEVTRPQEVLQSGATPALAQSRDRCAVFKTQKWLVLAIKCVRQVP
ncbi:MAG: hypothetical protein HC839_05405 [Leptolyngbyaceae cyanobacterium RM2_2_21]|nr:hypothetical protein [Leptolyngbyaceae cyanobacterium RM2_2_21]